LLYILIHLAGSLVAFDTTTENYTVPVSGKCVLTCYVAEVRSFKVLWQKIDRPIIVNNQTNVQQQEQLTLIAFDGIVYSNKDHYRLESDYVGSYNLIIDRVSEDDQGEYQCQINTEPRKTKRIFLTVQVPPRIVEFRPNPPLHTIRAGSPLTLSCRAEGTPMPQIRWRIRDVDVNRVDLLPPENNNVWFIPSISNTFPRTVECIADNGVLPASNRIFTINVEYPPVAIVNNDLIQTQQYRNVTLECHTSSRPIARIYWEKNGKMIGNDNTMSNTQVNQTMATSRLMIQTNNEDDFGQYTCIAENVHGRTEAIVFVLKESFVLLTTTPKVHRHPKHDRVFPSRSHSNRLIPKSRSSTTTTTMGTSIERDIRISSSSSSASQLTYHMFLVLLLIFLFPNR